MLTSILSTTNDIIKYFKTSERDGNWRLKESILLTKDELREIGLNPLLKISHSYLEMFDKIKIGGTNPKHKHIFSRFWTYIRGMSSVELNLLEMQKMMCLKK